MCYFSSGSPFFFTQNYLAHRALHEVQRRSKPPGKWCDYSGESTTSISSWKEDQFSLQVIQNNMKPTFFPSTDFTQISKSKSSVLKRVLAAPSSCYLATYSLVRIKHIFVGQIWIKVLFSQRVKNCQHSQAQLQGALLLLFFK